MWATRGNANDNGNDNGNDNDNDNDKINDKCKSPTQANRGFEWGTRIPHLPTAANMGHLAFAADLIS
jgi:hypothetical protein